jgi:hypothetical protein
VDALRPVTADTALDDGCKEEKTHVYPATNIITEAQPISGNGASAIIATIPNPAGNDMTARYTLEKNTKQAELFVRDIYGSMIGHYPLNVYNASQDLSFSEVRNGIYFIVLVADGKITDTKKVIVLH